MRLSLLQMVAVMRHRLWLAADLMLSSHFEETEAMLLGVNAEKLQPYYKALHALPWPGVMKQLKDCHIQNYSIFEREIEGNLYLLSYLEYTGNNFDADIKKMADDP